MGSSSKVLLVGATSLIVGTYAISLKQVQTNEILNAKAEVSRVQTEKVLDAALRAGLDDFVSHNGDRNKSGTLDAIDGGSFSYSLIKNSSSTATLTVTLTRDGATRVATASVQKVTGQLKQGSRKIHRGKWQVSQSFVGNQ